MKAKLKNRFRAQKVKIEKLISGIDFGAFKKTSGAAVHRAFTAIDDHARDEILEWLDTVEEIKSNPKLNRAQKEGQISKIKTTAVVFHYFKSLIDSLLHKLPVKQKGLLTSMVGVGLAVWLLNVEISAITIMIYTQTLPKLIMSPKFDEFADFVRTHLEY